MARLHVLFLAFWLAAAPVWAQATVEPNVLQAIDHGTLPGGRLVLRFAFARPVAVLPESFRTWHPQLNIVLDFTGMASALGELTREVDFRGVHRVRVAESSTGLRLTVDLDQPLIKEEISRHGNDVWLTLAPAPALDREAQFIGVARR